MESAIGQGKHYFQDFAVDFSSHDTHLGGKVFPKGYLAVAVMNYGKEVTTQLLYAGAACYQAIGSIQEDSFSIDQFREIKQKIDTICDTLSALEPFCYLDNCAERRLLDAVFSEEAELLLEEYYTLREQYRENGDLKLSEDEKLRLHTALIAEDKIKEVLRSYTYFCNDIANFATVILNLEAMKLRDLPQRNEAAFAKAYSEFFSDPEIQEALYLLQPSHGMAGFSLTSDVRTEVILLPNAKHNGELEFAKRYRFCRVMDFLVTDFFEGLHAGHSPKQCLNCGRYFHMTTGRHQLYCNDMAPGDPKRRSCRTKGKRDPMMPMEKAQDDPANVLYKRRLGTINKHLHRGKIDEKFAAKARDLAEEYLTKARRSTAYLREQYPQDISQEGLYDAVAAALGRPPRQMEG